MIAVVALARDLMDRSRLEAVPTASVSFARDPADLVVRAATADAVVVDLTVPGVVDVLADISGLGVRTIGYAPHVDTEVADQARASGCSQVVTRSVLFARLAVLLG